MIWSTFMKIVTLIYLFIIIYYAAEIITFFFEDFHILWEWLGSYPNSFIDNYIERH